MKFELPRHKHIDEVLAIAAMDQRLLDTLQSRPHLLNPYPSISKRLARRSRKYRLQMAGRLEPRAASRGGEPARLRLIAGGNSAA